MSADLIGRTVSCVTTYGDVYTGTMTGIDGQQNVSLSGVTVTAYPVGSSSKSEPTPALPAPSSGAPIATMFVRSSTILYIDFS